MAVQVVRKNLTPSENDPRMKTSDALELDPIHSIAGVYRNPDNKNDPTAAARSDPKINLADVFMFHTTDKTFSILVKISDTSPSSHIWNALNGKYLINIYWIGIVSDPALLTPPTVEISIVKVFMAQGER